MRIDPRGTFVSTAFMAARGVPVNEIAKAVSGAVASVLSDYDGQGSSRSPASFTNDVENFKPPLKKRKPGKYVIKYDDKYNILCLANYRVKASGLPSSFMAKKQPANMGRYYVYDRDIICLPSDHCSGNVIRIPRSRESLYEAGLVGRIRLTSDMSEDEIYDEIRSVFDGPMRGNRNFKFNILQGTGGSTKTLVVPSLSSSYKWTASAVAPKNVKTPIYILAREPLKVCNYSLKVPIMINKLVIVS